MKIFVFVSFILLLTAFFVAYIKSKAFIKKEKDFLLKANEAIKEEVKSIIERKDNEVKQSIKSHKRNVKQYIKAKTKKAVKDLKSGKIELNVKK